MVHMCLSTCAAPATSSATPWKSPLLLAVAMTGPPLLKTAQHRRRLLTLLHLLLGASEKRVQLQQRNQLTMAVPRKKTQFLLCQKGLHLCHAIPLAMPREGRLRVQTSKLSHRAWVPKASVQRCWSKKRTMAWMQLKPMKARLLTRMLSNRTVQCSRVQKQVVCSGSGARCARGQGVTMQMISVCVDVCWACI